jgi:hypothetical protein
MWKVTESKNGLSARELARELHLTYPTASKMLHKLRSVMSPSVRGRLGGDVVIDFVRVGPIRTCAGKGEASGQFVVAVATDIVSPWESREVRLRRIPNGSSASLLGFLSEVAGPSRYVHTDKIADEELLANGYGHGGIEADEVHFSAGFCAGIRPWLRRVYEYGHTHTKEQWKDDQDALRPEPTETSVSPQQYSINAIMPRVRTVTAEFTAWLRSTHQNGCAIAEGHLNSYLDEFTFRSNFREEKAPGMVFHRLLKAALVTQPTRQHGSLPKTNKLLPTVNHSYPQQ